MTLEHWPHCGERLAPEVVRPKGCVCDPWGDDPIPPICDEFDGVNHEYCGTCEHDRACHQKEA